jgi:tetrahydromethanopterin S-methyltransferase subunit A
VDVRIGVVQSAKEIELELQEGSDPDQIATKVEEALSADSGVLWLTDRKGRRVGIPAGRIAYVELNSPSEDRRVGFGAAVRG